jgi:hypothetical protein
LRRPPETPAHNLTIVDASLIVISINEWKEAGPLWRLLISPFGAIFFLWLFKLLAAQFLNLSFPSWSERRAIVRLRYWARRMGARWRQPKASNPSDAG